MYKLFFAWQNQDAKAYNFLKKQLKKVVTEIKCNYEIDIEIIYSPTQSEPGSPEIVKKIWEQITMCDVFVADLSHICILDEKKQISNPNVLYETGIADSLVGESKSILLASRKSEISSLAFDVNHKRISPFSTKNEDFYKELSEWVFVALKESTIQTAYKQYICKDIISNTEIIYTNMMRIAHGNIKEYPEGYHNISFEEICKSLRNTIYNSLQIKADYSQSIKELEQNIKELIVTKDRELIYEIIQYTKSLSAYQKLNKLSQYNSFECVEQADNKYVFQDNNSFVLNDVSSFNSLQDDVMFGENRLILSKLPDYPCCNVFLLNSIREAYKECKTVVQQNMTVSTMRHYRLVKSSDIEIYAKYIKSIIEDTNALLDNLKMEPSDYVVKNGKKVKVNRIHFIEKQIIDS